MRVLFVADFIAGMRTFTCELVGELARRDIEVHLALSGPGEVPDGAASCALRARPDESAAESPAEVAMMANWVDERRVECDPDIIHTHSRRRSTGTFRSSAACTRVVWRGEMR